MSGSRQCWQTFKTFVDSSQKNRADGERLPRTSQIQPAAGLEGPPTTPWCQMLQLHSCGGMPGTNVSTMRHQVVDLA